MMRSSSESSVRDVYKRQVYAFHKVSEEDEMHEAKGDIVELYPVLFQLIMMEIPYKVCLLYTSKKQCWMR